jgi:fibrillarin-like rRNA methylase
MSYFEYRKKHFQKGEAVDLPDAATGVTVSSFGDVEGDGVITVEFLVPAGTEPLTPT